VPLLSLAESVKPANQQLATSNQKQAGALRETGFHARFAENGACVYVRNDIYSTSMSPNDKPLVWLHGEMMLKGAL